MFPGLSRKVESKEKFCYNDAYENQTGGCQDMITIAIVEDEEAYAKQLTEYIEKYQQESGRRFRVIRFTDGDEIVEKYTGEYDIILMDIQSSRGNTEA